MCPNFIKTIGFKLKFLNSNEKAFFSKSRTKNCRIYPAQTYRFQYEMLKMTRW